MGCILGGLLICEILYAVLCVGIGEGRLLEGLDKASQIRSLKFGRNPWPCALAAKSGKKKILVRGEALQHFQAFGQQKESESGSSRLGSHKLRQLPYGILLIRNISIEKVQQDNNHGLICRCIVVVVEDVRRRRSACHGLCRRDRAIAVFAERSKFLRHFVFFYLEIVFCKAFNRLSLGVGYHRIHGHLFHSDLECGQILSLTRVLRIRARRTRASRFCVLVGYSRELHWGAVFRSNRGRETASRRFFSGFGDLLRRIVSGLVG